MGKIVFDIDNLHKQALKSRSIISSINHEFPRINIFDKNFYAPNLRRIRKNTRNMELNEAINYIENFIIKIETEAYVKNFLKEIST